MSTIKRSAHRSQRTSENIKLALETLREKGLEYEQAVVIREQLQRRMALLEHLADDSSVTALLHQLAAKALTIKRRPRDFLLRGCEPSINSICLEAMPVSLQGYDHALLQRLAGLTVGDHIQVYKSFLAMAHPLAISANCHGEASPTYQQLRSLTLQYTAFNVLRSMIGAPATIPLTRSNLATWEPDSVPEGWYDRVAALLPVHQDFAQLVAAAIAVTQAKEQDAMALFVKQVAPQTAAYGCSAQLLRLHQLFDEYGRRMTAPFLTRVQIMGHVFMSALHMPDFPMHKLSLAFVSCWPFPLAGVEILKGYLRRPDIIALLNSNPAPAPPSLPNSSPGSSDPTLRSHPTVNSDPSMHACMPGSSNPSMHACMPGSSDPTMRSDPTMHGAPTMHAYMPGSSGPTMRACMLGSADPTMHGAPAYPVLTAGGGGNGRRLSVMGCSHGHSSLQLR